VAVAYSNKALMLQAFDALFNQRDYAAAAQFWSETYIRHSGIFLPAAMASCARNV
jgi:hypothetical protein